MARRTRQFLEIKETLTERQEDDGRRTRDVKEVQSSKSNVRSEYTRMKNAGISMSKYKAYVHTCRHATDGSGDNLPCTMELIEEVTQ